MFMNFDKRQKIYLLLLMVAVIILLPSVSEAATFDALKKTGQDIFTGLRDIIYPASAVGIIAVCIGGFFGNINWKWMTAIILGLIVISLCQGFVGLFVDSGADDIPANVMSGA